MRGDFFVGDFLTAAWRVAARRAPAAQDYLAIKQKTKFRTLIPHTGGRYNEKPFRKSQCPLPERLANALMRKGRNNGKKLLVGRASAAPRRAAPRR